MYRIYTEDIHRDKIEAILNRKFDGFTLYPARGCWHGVCENSLVVEISKDVPRSSVLSAAHEIKVENMQEAVLVSEIPESKATLV